MKVQSALSYLQDEMIQQILRGKSNNESIEEFQKQIIADAKSPSLELETLILKGNFLDKQA